MIQLCLQDNWIHAPSENNSSRNNITQRLAIDGAHLETYYEFIAFEEDEEAVHYCAFGGEDEDDDCDFSCISEQTHCTYIIKLYRFGKEPMNVYKEVFFDCDIFCEADEFQDKVKSHFEKNYDFIY